MKTILHIGCGPQNITSMPPYFQDGTWTEVRFDIDKSVNPDVIGDLRDLSIFEDNSIDAIFSSHNIEHISSHEIEDVFIQFRMKIKKSGFCIILCPDIESVAQAISEKGIEEILYVSPAGPINAIDVIYGHQAALEKGFSYMAHKTAFTAQSLASKLLSAGFISVHIVRDHIYGLHAIAFLDSNENELMVAKVLPNKEVQKEYLKYKI